jgi:hypothetical protein
MTPPLAFLFEGIDGPQGCRERSRVVSYETPSWPGFQWKAGPGERTGCLSLKTPLLFDFKARTEAGRFRGIFPPALSPLIVQAGSMGRMTPARKQKCSFRDGYDAMYRIEEAGG